MRTKISTIVDGEVWKEFKDLAEETHQNIGGLLGEALREFIFKRRIRPTVIRHMEDSIAENEELGHLLAK